MQTLNPGDSATVRRFVSEPKGRPGLLLKLLQADRAAPEWVPACQLLSRPVRG
jgi:hypothetical protein